MYAISGGIQKPAKHILLPWVVKSLTGNVELVRFLNILGHSISYTQLEEFDTALCLQKLSCGSDSGIVMPSNIIPCIQTCLAYDNIDRLEETLSGAGTSHRVNGIAVQPSVPTVKPLLKSLEAPKTKQKRSIEPPTLFLTAYYAGTRPGPPKMASVDIDCTDVIYMAHLKNRYAFFKQFPLDLCHLLICQHIFPFLISQYFTY